MSSNLKFKSNVYPISGYLENDAKYLSEIYDYVRLKQLDKRISGGQGRGPWNTFQRQIIRESPTCSLGSSDPCWGLVRQDGVLMWGCKCIQTGCSKFKECRPDFDIQELELFSPRYAQLTDYDYAETFKSTVSAANGNNDEEYDGGQQLQAEKNNVPAFPTLPYVEIVEALKNEVDSHPTTEFIEKINVDISAEHHPVVPASPIGNIFDYFTESTQTEIIKAQGNALLFADAGPGTGKTHTLIKKIEHLVTEYDMSPESIVVLCFSNAAVDEIRSRLNTFVTDDGDRSLINVDVRTFHSFSWWLIGQCNELFKNSGWEPVSLNASIGFDKSIQIATIAMKQFAKDIVENWQHFIVDEVQDLTNDLARFVLEIISSCVDTQCGVTLLGDACQSIYDYTTNQSENPMTSYAFYDAVFNLFYGKARFLNLQENRRQQPHLSKMTDQLRRAYLSNDVDKMCMAVHDLKSGMDVLDKSLSGMKEDEINKLRNRGKLSVLLRNNGQALKVSSDFRKRGIPHQLNVKESHFNFAPWIADIFGSYKKLKIAFDTFEEYFDSVNTSKYNATFVWKKLQKMLHCEDDVLPVKDILERISELKIDDTIFRLQHTENLIVSTIHRAKGREFDSVLIDKSLLGKFNIYPLSEDESNLLEEFKILYVAMTRPKSNLIVTDTGESISLKREKARFALHCRRWRQIKKRGNSYSLIYLEFISEIDLDVDQQAILPNEVTSSLTTGDSVYLKRKIKNEKVYYIIIHEKTDECLGIVNNTFAEDIMHRMSIKAPVDMPDIVKNLYISGVYSKIVTSEFLTQHPELAKFAPNGVWKWFDIIGAGHLSYDKY